MTTVSGVPHWDDDPDSWDTCVLGSVTLPGFCQVKITRGQKLDAKSAKGKNKATLTLQGQDAAKVVITWKCSERSELAAYAAAIKAIEPVAGKTSPTALDLVHPAALLRGVAAIAVETIDGPSLDGGIITTTINGIEFQVPKKTSGLGKGSGTSNGFVFGFFSATGGTQAFGLGLTGGGGPAGAFKAHAKQIGPADASGFFLWLGDDGKQFRALYLGADPDGQAAFDAKNDFAQGDLNTKAENAGATAGNVQAGADDVTTTPQGAVSNAGAGAGAAAAATLPPSANAGP